MTFFSKDTSSQHTRERRLLWVLAALSIGYITWSWPKDSIAWFWFDLTYLEHFFSAQSGFETSDDVQASSYAVIKQNTLADSYAIYPRFLKSVADIFGTIEAVPKVQIVALSMSIFFLSWSFVRALSAPCLALIIATIIFCKCALIRFDSMIMQESLFLSFSFIMVGFMLMFLERPTVRLAVLGSLMCGLAIAVRPAGLSLLAVWPVALWFVWNRYGGQRSRLVAGIIGSLALCTVAETVVWRVTYDGSRGRPNLANVHLFAKVLMMEREPEFAAEHLRDSELMQFLTASRKTAEPLREAFAASVGWRTRAILLEQFETGVQLMAHRPPFRPWIIRLSNRTGAGEGLTNWNHILGEVSWAALFASPGYWAANAWTHYRALWANYRIYDEDFSRRHMAYIGTLDEDRLLEQSGAIEPLRPKVGWAVSLNRIGTLLFFLASMVAILAAAWLRLARPSGGIEVGLQAAAVAALMVHGYFLLASVFGVAQMRYAATMWPFQILCSLLLLHWLLERIRFGLRASSKPLIGEEGTGTASARPSQASSRAPRT